MKVYLAIDIYNPNLGGASEWVRELSIWLTERGYRVSILCERADAPIPSGCQLRSPRVSEWKPCPWQRALRLQRLVGRQPDGLVHDTGYLLGSDIFHPLMGSRMHNEFRQMRAFPPLRALVHLHGSKLWQVARMQWRQMRKSRYLVACSQRVVKDFAQLGRVAHQVIRNGIAAPLDYPAEAVVRLRSELGATGRRLVLLTSNNHYLKGVPNLLRALTLLSPEARSELMVVVAGHNREPELQRFVEANRLGDCCLLAGWVEDIGPYYQAADIFFHPTHHDAGSLSTMKALAAGCAVATSRWDGSSELIQAGQNGLVLESPRDSRQLASVLTRLLDRELTERMGLEARRLMPALAQERGFEQVEQLYRSLRETTAP